MGSEWTEHVLADICDSIDYGFTTSAKDEPVGPKFLRITDIVSGHIDWNAVPYCESDPVTTKKYLLHDNDIVIARTGASTGSSMFISAPPKAVFASYLVRLQLSEKAHARFIAYFLRSSEFWIYMRGVLGDKSAQPNASAKTMTQVKLRLPPLPEQLAIANILGSLDDKIELNRKTNETLEAMARAIFKSWFVDFDPVHTRRGDPVWSPTKGADTKVCPYMTPEILNLFPDSFEDSELGLIPKGWKVTPIGNLCSVSIGKTPPRKEHHWFSTDPFDVRWVSIRDLGKTNTFIMNTSEYLTTEAIEKFNIKIVPGNTVILSFKLTIGRVAITVGKMLTNEAIAHFILEEDSIITSKYLYCYLKTFDYNSLGSTSSIATAINSKIVKTIPIIVPPIYLMKAFTDQINAIFGRIKNNLQETNTLSFLRDTLLPKLISGELRVRDAKKFVEEAGV